MRHPAQRRSLLGVALTRVTLGLLLLSLSSVHLGCARRPPPCSSENLLDRDTPLRSQGVIREQRMVDGMAPEPGARLHDFVAAYFASPHSYVTYDLGHVSQVGSIQIVTNNRAARLVSKSLDGVAYSDVPLDDDPGALRPGQLFVRQARDADAELRYLRIEMQPDHRGRAVAEVLAFCRTPLDFPVALEAPEGRRQRVARLLSRGQVIYAAKAELAIALLAALLLLRRGLGMRPRAVAIMLIAVGTLAFARFGDFVGDGEPIHAWDAMHYYLGSKYFRELGYSELYRCIARHERESGRGRMIDRGQIRNLDDYVIYSGDWTTTPVGACRTGFSPERWRAFGEDVDRFRRMFDLEHFHATLSDHGYNATPIQTAWLMPLTNSIPSTRSGLRVLVTLDLIAIGVAAAALWWAFGPLAAGISLVVLGLGAPWSALWTGGSIGRFAWLGLLCAGLALLKKDRLVTGALLVTLSGLIRLFPLVFVASMLLKIAADTLRQRELRPDGKRMLLGIFIGAIVGGAVVARDVGALRDFIDNAALHATILPRSRLGLGVIASLGSAGNALEAFRAGDGSAGVLLGSLLWAIGFLLAGAFLLRQVWRPCQPGWKAVCFAAPLLFASVPLAGYDYAWLLVLVPVLATSPQRIALLLVSLAALDLVALAATSSPPQNALASAVIGLLLVAVFWHERVASPAG